MAGIGSMHRKKLGDMRHRVSIERRGISFDDLGHEQEAWKPISCNIPAIVEELSGRELERAKQLVAEATHRVTIRVPSSLSTADRLVYKNRIFEIRAKPENEVGTICDLLCVEEPPK
jgi:SPP1 family predicted phage head-tail adaptor